MVESFDDTDETDQTIKSSEAEPSMSSLLGLHCNMEDDCLGVCHAATKEVPGEITQRVVVSFVASVFDPLVFCAAFTIRLKILLKTILSKFGQLWDEETPSDGKVCCEDFAKELQQLKDKKLGRCHFREKPSSDDLHFFSDASLEAMCVVAYFRAETDSGVEVSFVIRKSPIAPVKQKIGPTRSFT